MMLSHILRNLTDDRLAEEALIGLGDLVLWRRSKPKPPCSRKREGNMSSVRCAGSRALAKDEDWLAVMGKLERGERPAEAFLPLFSIGR